MGHSLGMTFDPDALAESISMLGGSPLQLEMTVRSGQALELTDSLWELVPLVVAAGQRYDETSPAEVADAASVAKRLAPEVRQRIRDEADRWAATCNAMLEAQPWDENALASVTAADMTANPFGTVLALADLQSIAEALVGDLLNTSGSIDEFTYRRTYLGAIERARRTPMLLRALFLTTISTLEPLGPVSKSVVMSDLA
jgi:hypothetical protein